MSASCNGPKRGGMPRPLRRSRNRLPSGRGQAQGGARRYRDERADDLNVPLRRGRPGLRRRQRERTGGRDAVLRYARTRPAAVAPLRVVDDLSPNTRTLRSGATTNDRTPTVTLTEPGLTPAPYACAATLADAAGDTATLDLNRGTAGSAFTILVS